jgi:signal transduction histidine kinase
MSTLRSVIGRLAYLVRCAGIVYIAAQVAIWHSFYMSDPRRLAAPVVAMGWAAAVAIYLRRKRPTSIFACIDSAVYVVLALSAQGSVPPSIRGHAFSWLVISVSTQVIVPAWYTPVALSLPLVFASLTACLVGARRIADANVKVTAVTAVLLIAVAVTHLIARRLLYARAAAADAALDSADLAASEQYVILSRNVEQREQDRMVHDTVLNTLTALARADGEGVAAMVRRCRQDVALIEARLSDSGDATASVGPDHGDLVGDLQAVAAEMRTRGLDVHVAVAGNDAPAVPATVATAISGATREALVNIIAHARTWEAWVEVSFVPPGRVHVTVRDHGAGFDPASVDPARLGLRRSIAERTADCGGQASIWSLPGRGTVVHLSWPAPVIAAPVIAAPAGRPLAEESTPW